MHIHQAGVFISYRRSASYFLAPLIYRELHSNDFDVFMDVQNLDSGQFDQMIMNQIAARGHFVVLFAPGTVERFMEPYDLMRREIERALELKRNIVPVLSLGFEFKDYEEYFIGPLRAIPGINALKLYDDYLDQGLEMLRSRFLKQRVQGKTTPAPASERRLIEERLEELEKSLTFVTDDTPPEEFLYRGVAEYRAGKFQSAIASYSRAILLRPDYELAYYNRGIAFNALGDREQALADLDESIRLNPNRAKAYPYRGSLRLDTGDLEGAVADYTDVFRFKASEEELSIYHSNRAEAYFALGLYPQALADFAAALGFYGKNLYARAGHALALYALGYSAEALAEWQVLVAEKERFLDAEWVGTELNWRPELIEAARQLIAGLDW